MCPSFRDSVPDHHKRHRSGFRDAWLDVFQKIREMEGKLELQRRQLKELEEKVGGPEC